MVEQQHMLDLAALEQQDVSVLDGGNSTAMFGDGGGGGLDRLGRSGTVVGRNKSVKGLAATPVSDPSHPFDHVEELHPPTAGNDEAGPYYMRSGSPTPSESMSNIAYRYSIVDGMPNAPNAFMQQYNPNSFYAAPVRDNTKKRSSVLPALLGNIIGINTEATPIPKQPQLQRPQTNRLKSDFLSLMHDEETADTSIIVGEDLVEFKAHRIILIARAEFFRHTLAHDSHAPTQSVDLSFLDPDAFRIILRHLYTAEEDDEITDMTSLDWRLALAACRAATFLGMPDRAKSYGDKYVALFSFFATPGARQDKETCREMWVSADELELDDLMVACAPTFWKVFGGGDDVANTHSSSSSTSQLSFSGPAAVNNSGSPSLSRAEVGRLLGNRLDCLIKVVNAIPSTLETPIGKFRLVKSWLLSRPLPVVDDEEEVPSTPHPDERASAEATDEVMELDVQRGIRSPKSQASLSLSRSRPRRESFIKPAADDAAPASPTTSNPSLILSPPISPDVATNIRRSTVSNDSSLKKRRESGISSSTTLSSSSAGATPSMTPLRRAITEKKAAIPASIPSLSRNAGGSFVSPASGPSQALGETQLKASARAKALAQLDLSGISGADIAMELEPSGLFSDRQILALYRAAALEKAASVNLSSATQAGTGTGGNGGGPLWMPIPSGHVGIKYLAYNTKTQLTQITGQSGAGGISSSTPSIGSPPSRAQSPSSGSDPHQHGDAVGASISTRYVTYCTVEPLSQGKYTWTVIPTHNVQGIGIGVSADTTTSPAATSALARAASRMSLLSPFINFVNNNPSITGLLSPVLSDSGLGGRSASAGAGGYFSTTSMHDDNLSVISGSSANAAVRNRSSSISNVLRQPTPISSSPSQQQQRPHRFEDDIDTDAQDLMTPPPTQSTTPPATGFVAPPRLSRPATPSRPPQQPLTPAPQDPIIRGATPPQASASSQPRFVGDEGGWCVWPDGSLRVGKIFVGRLPKGLVLARGVPVTVKLDLEAKTLGLAVGGVDCGVAFRNVGAGGPVYPSVSLCDGASVMISKVVRK